MPSSFFGRSITRPLCFLLDTSQNKKKHDFNIENLLKQDKKYATCTVVLFKIANYLHRSFEIENKKLMCQSYEKILKIHRNNTFVLQEYAIALHIVWTFIR